jgi:hypothetical protein
MRRRNQLSRYVARRQRQGGAMRQRLCAAVILTLLICKHDLSVKLGS